MFLPPKICLEKNVFSCIYASASCLHTYSLCSFPGRVQIGANLLPTGRPTHKDQMLVRQSPRLRWRHSSLLHTDTVVQPHSCCAEWPQRPRWTVLWYPMVVSRETRSSYVHLPKGHWFPAVHYVPHTVALYPARLSCLCGSPLRCNCAKSKEKGASVLLEVG